MLTAVVISAVVAAALFVGIVVHESEDPSGKCQRRGKRVIITALIALGAGMAYVGVTYSVGEGILMLLYIALTLAAILLLIALLIFVIIIILTIYCKKTGKKDPIFYDGD